MLLISRVKLAGLIIVRVILPGPRGVFFPLIFCMNFFWFLGRGLLVVGSSISSYVCCSTAEGDRFLKIFSLYFHFCFASKNICKFLVSHTKSFVRFWKGVNYFKKIYTG